MVSPVTDPDLLKELEGDSGAVSDPALLAELEGTSTPPSTSMLDTVSRAVSNSPLGMAAIGANAVGAGINKVMNAFPVSVSPSVQQGAKRLFSVPKALGVGVTRHAIGQSLSEVTQGTVDSLRGRQQPGVQGTVDKFGEAMGENAAVVVAGAVSPMFGGPAAMLAQQAQSGKVSPVPLIFPALAGTKKIFDAAQIRERTIPPFLKASKGIPTEATKIGLEDPGVINLPGTSQSVQGKVQSIIDGVKEAQTKVGDEFGNTYKEFGMNSPVDEIIAGNKPKFIGKGIEELRKDYGKALSGDLFKKQNMGGGVEELSTNEKLATLTELKRAIQDQTIYPPAGQKLSQFDGSHNAAMKKMAADIDQLRGTIPGGEKLALADDAFSELLELKQRLVNQFKDPYIGQDYLNRIMKGNTDWLTSGRNAGRVGAIERIEEITGKELLKPALKEMAAAYLKNPETMGLSSTRFQAIISALLPTKMFLKSMPKPTRLFGAGLVSSTVGDKARTAATEYGESPSKNDNGYGNGNNNDDNSQGDSHGVFEHSSILSTPSAAKQGKKVLDEKNARKYLKEADGDKAKARELALRDGWLIR